MDVWFHVSTSTLNGGELHASPALSAEKEPPVPIGEEVGWAPDPV